MEISVSLGQLFCFAVILLAELAAFATRWIRRLPACQPHERNKLVTIYLRDAIGAGGATFEAISDGRRPMLPLIRRLDLQA